LATPDAEDLLTHPERWILGTDDGHVQLAMTDHGRAQPWQRWHELATPLASTLRLSVSTDTP
jgi:hypothetical protein